MEMTTLISRGASVSTRFLVRALVIISEVLIVDAVMTAIDSYRLARQRALEALYEQHLNRKL